jgi:5'-nucleotidase
LTKLEATGRIAFATADRHVTALFAPYAEKVDAYQNQKIAEAKADLLHIRSPGIHPSGVKLMNGSEAMPLVTKAFFHKVAGQTAVDGVIVNTGMLRKDILKGPITVKDVFELLPFENELVIVTMKARDAAQVIDAALDKGGGYPYLYNLKVDANTSQKKGRRVAALYVRKNQKWRKTRPDMLLKIIMPSYLVDGGDDYKVAPVGKPVHTGIKDSDALMDYLTQHPVIDKVSEP